MALRALYLKVQMDVKIEGACDWCCDLSRRCAPMPDQEQWRSQNPSSRCAEDRQY